MKKYKKKIKYKFKIIQIIMNVLKMNFMIFLIIIFIAIKILLIKIQIKWKLKVILIFLTLNYHNFNKIIIKNIFNNNKLRRNEIHKKKLLSMKNQLFKIVQAKKIIIILVINSTKNRWMN